MIAAGGFLTNVRDLAPEGASLLVANRSSAVRIDTSTGFQTQLSAFGGEGITTVPIPEPGTALLVLLGLGALAARQSPVRRAAVLSKR